MGHDRFQFRLLDLFTVTAFVAAVCAVATVMRGLKARWDIIWSVSLVLAYVFMADKLHNAPINGRTFQFRKGTLYGMLASIAILYFAWDWIYSHVTGFPMGAVE